MREIICNSEVPEVIVNIDLEEVIAKLENINSNQTYIYTVLLVIAILLAMIFMYKAICKMFGW